MQILRVKRCIGKPDCSTGDETCFILISKATIPTNVPQPLPVGRQLNEIRNQNIFRRKLQVIVKGRKLIKHNLSCLRVCVFVPLFFLQLDQTEFRLCQRFSPRGKAFLAQDCLPPF